MPERVPRFCCSAALTWLACSALLATACLVKAPLRSGPPSLAAEESLKTFLKSYLRTFPGRDDPTARYSAAFVDLNGDGKPEVIVYISGRNWCGTGGCPTLILASMGSSYSVVTHITITRPPIRLSKNLSHGWRNISVWVAGGGIDPAYQAELRFDGVTYPSNPTVPPARPLAAKAVGEVVISGSEEGTPLYP
jgi:hypothetical protein